jgi:ribosomal protein L11 methyltransferase
MLQWLEVSVTTDPEAGEAVSELFNRYGHGGAVVETPVDCLEHELAATSSPSAITVKAYLPLDGTADQARQRLEEGLWHLSQIYPLPAPVIRELEDEDWAESWKGQYHRLHVGKRIVVVPTWEHYAPKPKEIVIRLEPGMAFGTGLHPTTRLCLQAIEEHLIPGCTVLDIGTGSGVLAIAAAGLGAAAVLALDADPVAVTAAEANVARNGVSDGVTVQHGSLPGGEELPRHFTTNSALEYLETGHFDLILMNILAPVIIGMAAALAARCRSGGQLIVAGLIDNQETAVLEALHAQGFEVIERNQEKDWVSLVTRRR